MVQRESMIVPLHARRPHLVAAVVGAVAVLGLLSAGVVALADSDGGKTHAHGARSAQAHAAPRAPTATAAGVQVRVNIDLARPGRPVQAAYLGLSFEATDLGRLASYGEHGDLPGLLRSLGPGVLRFGGVSADTRIAWTDAKMPLPAWTARSLRAGDFEKLRVLAQRSGWRVLLTVGLAHFEPERAAHEVAAAQRLLGPWLAGIEVGNEPDAYGHHGFRGPGWGSGGYIAETRAYRRAIGRLAPGVPLLAPGVSGSHVFTQWGPAVVSRLRLLELTGHHYPLGCHRLPPPSLAALLSPATRHAEGASLRRYLAVALRSGLPFRMDEAGSVSCGGRAGISNTFGSALWAAAYIGQALSAGVSGINLQGNPANCQGYSPVCAAGESRLSSGSLGAQPVWYALLLTRGLTGYRPLASTVYARAPRNLVAWPLRSPSGGLAVLVVDDDPPGSAPSALTIAAGGRARTGTVLSLTAPSPEATGGVLLGGRAVSADGSFKTAPLPAVPVSHGLARVTVPAASAALVSIPG
jgi:hypothetical protein